MRFDWTGASPETTTTDPCTSNELKRTCAPSGSTSTLSPFPFPPFPPFAGARRCGRSRTSTPPTPWEARQAWSCEAVTAPARRMVIFSRTDVGERQGKGSAHGGSCRVDRIASAHPYPHINEFNNPNHPHYSRTTSPAASTLATVDSIPIRHRLPPSFPSFAALDAAESEASEGASKMAMSCAPKSARTWAAEVGLTWPKLFWGCWVDW